MLVNLYGYKVIIHYLNNRSTAQLSAHINSDEFEEDELISIKTRLSLPYYTNSETYERVDGVISIEGKYYNYVKRRVFNDSLELLCLPNTAKTKLEKIEIDFSKNVAENSSNEKGDKTLIVKNILPEFYEGHTFATGSPEMSLITKTYSSIIFYSPSISSKVQTPPPNFMQVAA